MRPLWDFLDDVYFGNFKIGFNTKKYLKQYSKWVTISDLFLCVGGNEVWVIVCTVILWIRLTSTLSPSLGATWWWPAGNRPEHYWCLLAFLYSSLSLPTSYHPFLLFSTPLSIFYLSSTFSCPLPHLFLSSYHTPLCSSPLIYLSSYINPTSSCHSPLLFLSLPYPTLSKPSPLS